MAHDMEMVAWDCDSENPKQLAPMSRGSAILPVGSASYDSLWPYIFIGPLITELLYAIIKRYVALGWKDFKLRLLFG